VAAVGAIVTELVYFAVSVALVVAVGQALSRSGRAFLHEAYGAGQDGAAQAVSRLLVVAFYLLSMGFVVLTAPSWTAVTGAGQAAGLLSGKIGVLLLVLGFLHVTGTVFVARLRRRPWAAGVPAGPGPAGEPDGADGLGGLATAGPTGSAEPAGPGAAADSAGPADPMAPGAWPRASAAGRRRERAAAPALWRPERVVH
jgi:hypothetical protein